jgi:hypothetical protein
MAYATVNDVQARTTKTLTDAQIAICESLLDDVAVLIDSVAPSASDEVKLVVSCSVVVRALGSQTEIGIPLGATQGSASALGYSQSWTVGNGAVGELYLSRTEKRMLGVGNSIGSYSPVEELAT